MDGHNSFFAHIPPAPRLPLTQTFITAYRLTSRKFKKTINTLTRMDVIWQRGLFARGHTNRNRLCSCLFFVCVAPRKSPLAFTVCLSMFFAGCLSRHSSLWSPFLVSPLYFSTPSRVTLNRPPQSLGALTHTHYPTDFGKWMDLSLLFCCQYITFLALAVCPGGRKRDPAMYTCTLTKTSATRFGLGFSTNHSRLQTEKVQNELEGEGLEDCICSVRFFFESSFER